MRALLIFWILVGLGCTSELTETFPEVDLFVNGEEGYRCYRIPAIVKASNGNLLAFAEGRISHCGDFGNVDIVYKVSDNGGESWSHLRKLLDNESLQVGNPGPVVLEAEGSNQGRVIMFYNSGIASEHETRLGNGLREVWYCFSDDHGQSWSDPVNITTQTHRPNRPDINPEYSYEEDWRSYAVTPGHALQLSHGPHKGRILVPANHSAGPPQDGFNEYRAHAFYSDDQGSTFHLSDDVDILSSNEAIAAQLSDGRVMMNIRQQNGEQKRRLIALSDDGGVSWNEVYFDSTLITPVCQASLLSYQTPDDQDILLFSNPASTSERSRMTIKLSQDDGRSWDTHKLINAGPSAYSDLVQQEDDMIGMLYEAGNDGGIRYKKLSLAWLLNKEK